MIYSFKYFLLGCTFILILVMFIVPFISHSQNPLLMQDKYSVAQEILDNCRDDTSRLNNELQKTNSELNTIKNTDYYEENVKLNKKVNNLTGQYLFIFIWVLLMTIAVTYSIINRYQTNRIKELIDENTKTKQEYDNIKSELETKTDELLKLKKKK